MSTSRSCLVALASAASLLSLAHAALASEGSGEFPMPQGDACIRRTDFANSGAMLPNQSLPDLINISLQRWQPSSPATDPYTGSITGGNANIFKLELTFKGLVNPPGTLGLSGGYYDPFTFGKSPVFGFVELDVDDEYDTGGESVAAAAIRPLGQASRFGGRFRGSIGERQARTAADLNQGWQDEPLVALSGADFSLVLCGCAPITVISKSDPQATCFGPGQTWIVRAPFFQRSGGYSPASLMTGGSTLGAYDPPVNLRFQHDLVSDTTTITLVHALTQTGAALLAGESAQPINTSAADHTSVAEGATDLVMSAARPGLSGLTYELIHRWQGTDASDALNPRRWNVRAIVGTAFPQQEDSPYIWTDVGPAFSRGDVNGDAVRNHLDRQRILAEIAALDGGPLDADAAVNAKVVLFDFGYNFSLYDVNADGVIDENDLLGIPACTADFNASGALTVQDVFDFLNAWFLGAADFNASGDTSVQDIFDFLTAWFAGCP